MANALRRPALHFAVLGALLFVLERRVWPPLAPERSAEVVIPANRIAARAERFARDTGRPPTAEERVVLVAEAVDEELLYREALARALDRDDRSIRGHLAEKMRFLEPANGDDAPALARHAVTLGLDRSDAFVRRVLVEKMRLLARRESEEAEPDDATLAAYMAGSPERWRLPARATVQQVFLRDADPERAAVLLARLRAGGADFARVGDAFHAGPVVPDAARPTLASLLGEAIAAHAFAAPLREWDGPLRSPWGMHLVRVVSRTAPVLPAVADVRPALVLSWREGRRQARERGMLAELRRRWRVVVEEDRGA